MAQVAAGGDTDVVAARRGRLRRLRRRWRRSAPERNWRWPTRESLVVGGEYVMRLAAEKRAPIPADRLGTFGHLPVPGGRAVAHTAAHHHVQRRRIPRPAVRKTGRRDRGTGAAPPPVGDGRKDHDRLVDAGEQRLRGDRGTLAVRHPGGENNGAAAPAVDRTLDGGVRGRGDQGAAGHGPTCVCRSVSR